MKILASNKKAHFDYEILQKIEAGIVLTGQEVKSVKLGHMSLKGAFVTVRGTELFLTNALIPRYEHADRKTIYDPTQPRKLLVKKSEIRSLLGKKKTDGLTFVPLRVYTRKRLVKLEFAVGRGKKKHDKRQSIAQREANRKMQRRLKNA